MKIAVIGSGIAGQAVGTALSKHDNSIIFVDVIKAALQPLQTKGYTTELADTYTKINTDITMFCVPASQLEKAVRSFAARLKNHNKYHTIVICSSIVPNTSRKKILPLIESLSGKKAAIDFGIVVQPLYARSETINPDSARPWFILIGELDKKSGDTIARLYTKFDAPLERMSLEEAEFQKYVHNMFNATKISFFNELRVIAVKEGWNDTAIFEAVAESSEAIWNPLYGIHDKGGFSGTGIEADAETLVDWAQANQYGVGIIKAVLAANKGTHRD